jgi:hypothetical protein
MKNIFKILEEEKVRILEMHENATKNQYLNEQQTAKIPTTYTVRNPEIILTGQNKKTTASAEDLKIFKGAKFIKQGNTIVAKTNYQFLDPFGNVIRGVGQNSSMREIKTYQGNVTYGCSTGKYTVNMRTDLMFYDKTLSPMLNKMCQAKTTETQPTTQEPKTQAPKTQAPKTQAPKSNTQLIDLNKQIQQSLGNQQPTGQITDTEIDTILTKLG